MFYNMFWKIIPKSFGWFRDYFLNLQRLNTNAVHDAAYTRWFFCAHTFRELTTCHVVVSGSGNAPEASHL